MLFTSFIWSVTLLFHFLLLLWIDFNFCPLTCLKSHPPDCLHLTCIQNKVILAVHQCYWGSIYSIGQYNLQEALLMSILLIYRIFMFYWHGVKWKPQIQIHIILNMLGLFVLIFCFLVSLAFNAFWLYHYSCFLALTFCFNSLL